MQEGDGSIQVVGAFSTLHLATLFAESLDSDAEIWKKDNDDGMHAMTFLVNEVARLKKENEEDKKSIQRLSADLWAASDRIKALDNARVSARADCVDQMHLLGAVLRSVEKTTEEIAGEKDHAKMRERLERVSINVRARKAHIQSKIKRILDEEKDVEAVVQKKRARENERQK